MEFVKAEGPGGLKPEGGRVTFDPAPILMPGEKAVWKVTCRALRPGSAKH
jgi:hypothetical protein